MWILMLLLVCGFDWPGRVEGLLGQLARPGSESQRRDFLRLLAATHDPRALDAVAHAVEEPSPILRAEALRGLAQSHAPRHVATVRSALTDAEPIVRQAAIAALGAMAPNDAVTLLARSLTDSEAAVRAESARALAGLHDTQAVAALSTALDDPSTDVRVAAARALGALGDGRGVGPLVGKARDGAPELREAVLDALQQLDAEGVDAEGRSTAVFAQGLLDSSDLVVFAALRAIARRGVAPFRATLRELATGPRPRVRAAASALVEDEAGPRAPDAPAWLPLLERTASASAQEAPALIALLEVALPAGQGLAADPLLAWLPSLPRALRPHVIRLVGRTGAASAAPRLVALLEGASEDEELALVEALGQVGAPEGVPALLARLASDRRALRVAAREGLSRSARPGDVPALAALVRSGPRAVRADALGALAALLERAPGSVRGPAASELAGTLAEQLQRADEAQFARATRCLALLGGDAALRALADAELPSETRRLALLRAASNLKGAAAGSLRTPREGDPAALVATALAAQAQADDPLDLAYARTPPERTPWPVAPAFAFALARAARPERARELAPRLCGLRSARDPWTRANALAGLARIPQETCADVDGAHWLLTARVESVRLAAAHWARARVRGGAAGGLARALTRCAERDGSARVRAACAGKELPLAAPGLRASGPVGLVLADGRVLVSFPDANLDPGWPNVSVVAVEQPSPLFGD